MLGDEVVGRLAVVEEAGRAHLRLELDQALFLLFEHVPSPGSIWDGMASLPAAHRFTFDLASGQVDVDRYWDLPADGHLRYRNAGDAPAMNTGKGPPTRN